MDPVTATIATSAALTSISTLYKALKDVLATGKDLKDTASAAGNLINAGVTNVADMGKVSLTSYIKPLCLSSRVYIDDAVYSDPIVTDVVKAIHTQYAAFVLTALQMNRYVTKDRDVQSMLRVVATEANEIHQGGLEDYASDKAEREIAKNKREEEKATREREEHDAKKQRAQDIKAGKVGSNTVGKVVSLAGDNYVPAGKLIEITLSNPDNDKAAVTLNLLIQLAPYLIPSPIAVQFITKDIIPSMMQRLMQWRTGEISFWRDLVAMSDIHTRREKLRRMDPSGVLDAAIDKETASRQRVFGNLNKNQADRSRNIANSVMIFSHDTVMRAKAESGIDITKSGDREKYFATSFAMIIAVVDTVYDRVTFYYNGLDDEATFSFDQLKNATKGSNGLDLVAVMNALGQGRSPKF
jgi:hypothetical protein